MTDIFSPPIQKLGQHRCYCLHFLAGRYRVKITTDCVFLCLAKQHKVLTQKDLWSLKSLHQHKIKYLCLCALFPQCKHKSFPNVMNKMHPFCT